jgi:hypothetical protein
MQYSEKDVELLCGTIDGLKEELARFKLFSDTIITQGAFEAVSFDGGDIQDLAVFLELLKPTEVDKPCGKNCGCVEFDFPLICYKKTYVGF